MILSADKQDYRNKPSSLEYQNKEDLLSSQPLLREAQRKVAMICLFCEIDINTLLGRNVSSNGNNNSKKVSDNRYERKVVIPSSEKEKAPFSYGGVGRVSNIFKRFIQQTDLCITFDFKSS